MTNEEWVRLRLEAQAVGRQGAAVHGDIAADGRLHPPPSREELIARIQRLIDGFEADHLPARPVSTVRVDPNLL